jgi:hypothetical protein
LIVMAIATSWLSRGSGYANDSDRGWADGLPNLIRGYTHN